MGPCYRWRYGLASTIGQGVWRYHEEDWSQISGNELHLPSQDIYAIALEDNGTPWVGTMGYGIASYRDEDWYHYLLPFEMAHPLTQDLVDNHAITAIVIDADGTKWFASDGSGVAAFDTGNQSSWSAQLEDRTNGPIEITTNANVYVFLVMPDR